MKGNSSADSHKKVKAAPAKQELWPLMFEMGRIMKREIHKDCMVLPSFLHIETLRFIEEQKEPIMREVADYLKIAPPSATAIINTLVKEGAISRSVDPQDRRIVRLVTTKKGQRLLDEIARKREEAFSRVVAPLSAADRKEFARILKIIIQNPHLNQ